MITHRHTSDEKLHILEKFRTPATGRAFYKIPEREKARGEGKGKVIKKRILRIIMAPKGKLEWRNTFKLSKQNNVQNPVCCRPNYVINQMQK